MEKMHITDKTQTITSEEYERIERIKIKKVVKYSGKK